MNLPLGRRVLRPEAGFFVLLLVAGLAVFREKAFRDPGALWHVRVGDLILADGFPRTDPFTYTFAGVPWVPQQWGAEVLMSLAHRATGLDGLLLGLAAGVAALYTWLFARLRQGGMAVPLAAVACAAVLFVGSFHYYARPHLWTVAGLGLTVAWVVDVDRGRRPVGFLAWLIPVCVVWTNLHGGVLGGILTLGLAVAGWLFTAALVGRQKSPIRSWRPAALAVGIVAACGLTPFVNPFGWELLDTWGRIVGSTVLKEAVSEHKPLSLAVPADRLVALLGAGYILVLAGALPKLRVTWLLPLAWLAYTVTSIRQGPLFAVAAGFALADVWPHTRWHRLLARYGDSLAAPPADPPPRTAWLLPTAAVLGVLGLQLAGLPLPLVGRGWARLDAAETPVAFTGHVQGFAAITGPHRHVYNDANFGGYLIYHAPALKIFMDDRFEQYGEAWTREYVDAVWRHPERFDAWDARWGFGLALVATADTPTPLDRHLASQPDRWAEVARQPAAVLYRKKPAP